MFRRCSHLPIFSVSYEEIYSFSLSVQINKLPAFVLVLAESSMSVITSFVYTVKYFPLSSTVLATSVWLGRDGVDKLKHNWQLSESRTVTLFIPSPKA